MTDGSVPVIGPQPTDRERILTLVDRLLDVYKPQGAAIWLTSKRFNGAPIWELLDAGRWDEVEAEIDRLQAGNFA